MGRSILSRFLAIFSSKVIGVFVMFLATPVIVRILGSERYGDYAFLLSVLSILVLFVNAGIYDGIRKYLKESDRSEDWPNLVFAFYTRLGVALVVAMSILMWLLVEFGVVGRFLGERFELYFLLVTLAVVSRQAFGIARSTLMGFDREDISERFQIYNSVLTVAFGLALIVRGYGVAGLVAAIVLANALTAALGFWKIASYVDYSRLFARTDDGFPSGQLMRFNLMSVLLFSLFISIKHVDIVLIQFHYDSQTTGYYKAALNLAEFVWFVPRIVQMTLLHSTSELWSEGKREAITDISAKVTRYSLLFTTLLIIGLAALAEPTVTLYYGGEFRPAVVPLIILLPGAMGFAVARPILAIGQGKGDFRYLIYATGGASILNLALNVVLIPRYGIAGAAVATSIGYFSMLVFHIASARAIGFDPIADLRLPKVTLTVVVATVAIFFLAGQFESILLRFAVVPLTGFLVYLALAVVLGAVSVDELRELREEFPV